MLRNIRRALISFVWVALSFAIYSVCVVPLVERSTRTRSREIEPVGIEGTATDRFVRELTPFFPEGSWELKNPRVLRNRQATLLLQDFQQRDDGSLHIQPCTLVFYDRGRDDLRQGPTILQAPEGAVLSFDELDLSRGAFGNPIGGRLVGEIRIFRAGGPNSEDLEIRTSNVQISNRRLWTRDKVICRLGNSFAVGSYLMLTRRVNGVKPASDSWIDGLGMAELEHLDRLSFRLADGGMFSALGGSREKDSTEIASPNTRFEIRCDGPLRFDLYHMVATVEENVTIARQVPDAETDTLRASQLSMHLAQARVPTSGPDDNSEPPLSLTRVIAIGEPLIVDAPSENAYVETVRLEYDFDQKQARLRGSNGLPAEEDTTEFTGRVLLRNAECEIECPAIDFSGSEDRSTWAIVAAGPGRYMGIAANQEDRIVSAKWEQSLSLQPNAGQQLLRMVGDTAVWSPDFGAIYSDVIEVEMTHRRRTVATKLDGAPVHETKTEPTKIATYSPRGKRTVIESPHINGTLSKLTVFLDHDQQQSRPPTAALATNAFAPADPNTESANSDSEWRCQLDGEEVKAWVHGPSQQLSRLTMTGQSRLVAQSPRSTQPFDVRGSAIDLQISASGQPIARLQGSPAVLETPDMRLTGSDIQLHSDQNRVEIVGSGTLRLPVASQAFPGQGASKQTDVGDFEIAWQGGLQFNGRKARVSENVIASSTGLSIQTADLEVTLEHPVNVSNLGRSSTKPSVAVVSATGSVFATNRSDDKSGNTESFQQMMTNDFSLDVPSGEMSAHGPGWLAMTSFATDRRLDGAPAPDSSAALRQLSVAFAKQLKGNLHQRHATIEDSVVAWYGPVQEWDAQVDPKQVDELAEGTFRLSCREVVISESPTQLVSDSRKPFEILASGETLIESQKYAALGRRLKYAEEKGMITLEGDAQRPAELWQRSLADGTSSHTGQMSRIRYWTESGDIEFSRLRLDLSSLSEK